MSQNIGHGHVFPRPDGGRARCGGPGICAECSRDQVRKDAGMKRDVTDAQCCGHCEPSILQFCPHCPDHADAWQRQQSRIKVAH